MRRKKIKKIISQILNLFYFSVFPRFLSNTTSAGFLKKKKKTQVEGNYGHPNVSRIRFDQKRRRYNGRNSRSEGKK